MPDQLREPTETAPDSVASRAATTFRRGRALSQRMEDAAFAVADRWAAKVQVRVDMAKVRVLPTRLLTGRVEPDHDDADNWSFLLKPALIGFLALVAVAAGASFDPSPFKVSTTGAWFFGVPGPFGTAPSNYSLFGLVLVCGTAQAQSPKLVCNTYTDAWGTPAAVTATAGTVSDAPAGYVVAAIADDQAPADRQSGATVADE